MDNLAQEKFESMYNNYLSDHNIGFRYQDFKNGDLTLRQQTEVNSLVFLTDGEIIINYNEFTNVQVKTREFFLIPKKSRLSLKAVAPGDFLIFSFDSFNSIFDKIALKSYSAIADQTEFTFSPLPIKYAINDFLYLLIKYIRNGLDTPNMVEVKQQELFILLRKFYDKNEMANLLHPILSKSIDFKDQVLEHYQNVSGVDELAQKIGMGRTSFDVKFKSEFGIPPLQWMLKQKAKHIRFSMAEPESTLSDIMRKYNFNSPTHLNRFCKQQFGCSPSELMKKVRPKE